MTQLFHFPLLDMRFDTAQLALHICSSLGTTQLVGGFLPSHIQGTLMEFQLNNLFTAGVHVIMD